MTEYEKTYKNSVQKKPKIFFAGLPIVISVLIVLILTVFSLISYKITEQELGLAKKAIKASTEYYAAESESEEFLYSLYKIGENLITDEEISDYIIANFDLTSKEILNDTLYITKDFEINETKLLRFSLKFENNTFKILERYVTNAGEWIFDDNINVWDGKQ